MSIVRNKHLGSVTGKVGDYIFRRTPSGKYSVYVLKKVRKKPDSEDSRNNNKRFALLNKFSTAVNDLYFLKEVWSSNRGLKGAKARDKIFAYNFEHCFPDCLHGNAKITPPGMICTVIGFKHDNDSFEIKMEPEPGFLNSRNSHFVASCIIYLNTPDTEKTLKTNYDNNVFITLDKRFDNNKFNADNTFNLKFNLGINALSIINDFKRVRVFCTLTYLSKHDKFLWTSSDSFLYKGHELDEIKYGMIPVNSDPSRTKVKLGLDSVKPDYFNFKIR